MTYASASSRCLKYRLTRLVPVVDAGTATIHGVLGLPTLTTLMLFATGRHGSLFLARSQYLSVPSRSFLYWDKIVLLSLLQRAARDGSGPSTAALEAFEDWTLPSAWAFVEAFPTPQALVSAGKRKWEKFLHTQKLARPQTYQKRMEIFARAAEFVSGQALTRAKSRLAFGACENAARAPEPDRLLPCPD